MTDVFISYSREDKVFVKDLKQRLEDQNLDVWVDIDELYAGEEFWPEVAKAIDAAAFIFVISPTSAASKNCHKEANWAADVGKRVVPLRRSDPGAAKLPDEVAQRQWVFFGEGDDPEAATADLLSAIKADWAELRQQARVLRRAREWQEKNEDASLLLRGKDLGDAIDWRTRNQGKETGATQFHDDYIDASVIGAKSADWGGKAVYRPVRISIALLKYVNLIGQAYLTACEPPRTLFHDFATPFTWSVSCVFHLSSNGRPGNSLKNITSGDPTRD